MKLDDFVQACWLLCGDWYSMKLKADQHWVIGVECQHAHFNIRARILRPEDGLGELYQQISDYHEDLNDTIS